MTTAFVYVASFATLILILGSSLIIAVRNVQKPKPIPKKSSHLR